MARSRSSTTASAICWSPATRRTSTAACRTPGRTSGPAPRGRSGSSRARTREARRRAGRPRIPSVRPAPARAAVPATHARIRLMPTIEVVLVDSFTATPFTGNPAAVVLDATALDERGMKTVAAELARPATAFLRPAGPGGARPVRWFSPAGIELTLCGHGTVAAAHVLAARGEAPQDALVFQAPRHRLAITMERAAAADTAWFEPDCPRWTQEAGDLSPFLATLGLPAHAMAAWAPPARTSEQDLLLPVSSLKVLGELAPDLGGLARLAKERGVRGVVLTARETRRPDALTHSRVFI